MNNRDGKWRVKFISGPRWFKIFLFLLRVKKLIYGDRGHNIARGKKWGKFKISEGIGSWIELKYIDWPVLDRVWFVTADKLKGEFFYNDKFTGRFEMTRLKYRNGFIH